MRLITAEQVHKVCTFPELVRTFDDYHRDAPADLKDMLMSSIQEGSTPDNHILIRAAWSHGSALGLKAATIFPSNTVNSDLPAIHAIYALFDGQNGIPIAVIDGTSLTYYKTAADSALGSKYLANSNVENMAMIGAGAMAPYLIQAHCAIHSSIRKVTIWNRTMSKAGYLAKSLFIDNVEIHACDDIESTVANAELVSSATMAKDPIIFGEWLKPGTHLDLVGAFTPEMREADDTTIRKSRVFVDSRKTTIGEIGEITIPIETGIISESDVLADLFDLCLENSPGRKSKEEITLFKNGGGGHLDLMTARFINSQI